MRCKRQGMGETIGRPYVKHTFKPFFIYYEIKLINANGKKFARGEFRKFFAYEISLTEQENIYRHIDSVYNAPICKNIYIK